MDLFSSWTLLWGKTIFYILMDIQLPSLPVSILYSHVSVLWLFFDMLKSSYHRLDAFLACAGLPHIMENLEFEYWFFQLGKRQRTQVQIMELCERSLKKFNDCMMSYFFRIFQL